MNKTTLGKKRQTEQQSACEDDNDNDEEDEEIGEEDRFVFEDENARQRPGDGFDVFKARIECAVNAVDIDALCDALADFDDANPWANSPWCREKSRERKTMKIGKANDYCTHCHPNPGEQGISQGL